MATFTSSLPDGLLERLDAMAKSLKLPKNKLMERALEIYLDQLQRAEYVASYKQAGKDESIMSIAEEGMTEYLTDLNENTSS